MSDTDLISQLRSDGSALCVEAAAEIQRLRDRLSEVERTAQELMRKADEEIGRLQTELAATTGSMQWPSQQERDDFRIEYDIPPNAPR